MKNALSDVTEFEILDFISFQTNKPFGVYFYTPTCGTCKIAEQMLNIAIQAGNTIPMYKINVNFALGLVEKWHIKSVPCIKTFQSQNEVNTMYAIHAVQDIYALIKL
jgi:thioredoxin-like negative regulator of GroEL